MRVMSFVHVCKIPKQVQTYTSDPMTGQITLENLSNGFRSVKTNKDNFVLWSTW